MIVLGIGLMTLILAGSGIMNMIMLSVRQRYKEIGIMRALGGKRDDILYLFTLEGALLSFYGLLIGVFLSTSYIALAGDCKLDIFLESLLWSSVICVLISFSGYYPASRASKISPCEAIREGIKG
ncbi:MAG: FtsX-like permease family protein, partial [bacterium]|nr:FtsX-like permease family protein [bacterium]